MKPLVAVKKAVHDVEDTTTGWKPWHRLVLLVALVGCDVGAVVYVGSSHPSLFKALGLAVILFLTGWATMFQVKQAVKKRWPKGAPNLVKIAVHAFAFVSLGAAAGFAVWKSRTQDTGGVAIYVSAIVGYVAVGVMLSRWRKHSSRRVWGPGILGGCVGVGVISLVIGTVNVNGSWLAIVGAALLVAPVGLALVVEEAFEKPWLPAGKELPWGVAAVAAGLAGLSLANIGVLQSLIVTVALLVLVFVITLDNSNDIALVVVVVALLWSLAPEEGARQPIPKEGTTASLSRTIVAIGDSYMSGEGASVFYEGTNHHDSATDRNECRRSKTAYPVQVQQLLKRGEKPQDYELLFIACSGARAAQFTTEAQYPAEPTSPWADRLAKPYGQPQLAQAQSAIAHRNLDPEIVLVSIGGNDAGFGEIGQTCGLAGDCSSMGKDWLTRLSDPDRLVQGAEGPFEDVRQRVRDVYAAIRTKFPNARVLIVPYPVPLNEAGCSASLLRPDEHRFLVGYTRALDRVLQEEALAVQAKPFEFLTRGVDVFTRARVRICDTSPSGAAVNQLAASPVAGLFLQQVSPRTWFHSAFHPNSRGHELIAREVADWVNGQKQSADVADAPLTLPGIMGVGFDHCGSLTRSPPTCHADRGSWMVAAMARMLWTLAIPVCLIVVGAMLVSLAALRRWRTLKVPD
jgi:lysophospholipase L1-like esterase